NKDFHENSNYGLVDVNDEPYPELTAMFARVRGEAGGRDVSTKRPRSGRAVGAPLPDESKPATRDGSPLLSEREHFFAEACAPAVPTAGSVGFHRKADGSWTLSNGLVRISGRVGGARMADEIAYGGAAPAGRWNALLQWRDNGVTQWTGTTRVTDIAYSRDEATGIGTVTIRAEGLAPVAPATGRADLRERPLFAITDRLSLAPGSADILAEIVALENTGDSPIDVEYLFLRPLAAEERPQPHRAATVPNLWKGPVEGWWRLPDGSLWGLTSRDPGVVSANLWFRKDDNTQHPDVRCLGIPPFTLAPGALFEPPLPIGARVKSLALPPQGQTD
ncbi:MAG: hypothetical protein IJS46_06150, partial [Kiritimatiellae bacterium]|nr:hypothetical protein [Kiritimatiellia bacterium]